jgi:hypothetical protein
MQLSWLCNCLLRNVPAALAHCRLKLSGWHEQPGHDTQQAIQPPLLTLTLLLLQLLLLLL